MTAPNQPDPARSAVRRGPSRWTLGVAAVAVAALLAPVAWIFSRPEPDAGVPLAQALGPSSTPSADATVPAGPVPSDAAPPASAPAPAPESEPSASPSTTSPFGEVGVRDASVDAATTDDDVPLPARLVVADLGVDAVVDAVGVEDDGSMVVPAEIDRVGWYRFGPAAGAERGNAVIAGHVDAAGEGPGALFGLRQVEVGTVVTVVDETGAEHDYEVVGRETVVKDVLPVGDIFARDGEHRLVVVTCGGPFLPELSSYRDNVVVTAVPVDAA